MTTLHFYVSETLNIFVKSPLRVVHPSGDFAYVLALNVIVVVCKFNFKNYL